jgi:hypothetical protein
MGGGGILAHTARNHPPYFTSTGTMFATAEETPATDIQTTSTAQASRPTDWC